VSKKKEEEELDAAREGLVATLELAPGAEEKVEAKAEVEAEPKPSTKPAASPSPKAKPAPEAKSAPAHAGGFQNGFSVPGGWFSQD